MTEPKKEETAATGTGSAAAAAETAGAVAAAPAAEAKPNAKPKPKKPEVKDPDLEAAWNAISPPPTVVVTGPEKGRWRIGRKFTREPSSIPATDLTEAQFLALQADPELHVQIVDAPH